MRIRLSHVTSYEYQGPAKSIIQILRLTPRSHDGQHVVRWRVEIDADAKLNKGEDALGNVIHTIYVNGPVSQLAVTVNGEIETWDTHGVVSGAVERFAPDVFLRDTPLTEADAELKTFARDVASAGGGDVLKALHELTAAVHHEMAFDTAPTDAKTSAAQAFILKRGVCQDLSHVFIAAARALGVPARYVSGH